MLDAVVAFADALNAIADDDGFTAGGTEVLYTHDRWHNDLPHVTRSLFLRRRMCWCSLVSLLSRHHVLTAV